MKFIVQKESTL